MNPAEEIVKFWLQEQGYFVQSSVRVDGGRGREIDILAMNLAGHKRHIEVSVSGKQSVLTRTVLAEAEKKSKKFNDSKIITEIAKRLGENAVYTKEFVIGNIGRGRELEYSAEMEKLGIKIIPISTVMKDVSPKLQAHRQLNSILQTVGITVSFLEEFCRTSETR